MVTRWSLTKRNENKKVTIQQKTQPEKKKKHAKAKFTKWLRSP